MKLTKDLVGKMVAIQVARPLYVMDYDAHIPRMSKVEKEADWVMIGPVMRQVPGSATVGSTPIQAMVQQPVAMDVLLSAVVERVEDDHIVVLLPTPGGHRIRKHVAAALVLSVDEMIEFDVGVPVAVKRTREVPQGNLIVG